MWNSSFDIGDPMSCLTHLLGAIFFGVLSIVLARQTRDKGAVFWFCVQYAAAVLFSLTMSFVFHSMHPGTHIRAMMLRVDVAAIFVLIASTFTAILGILFRDWRRWVYSVAIWTFAITGVILRTIYFDRISMLFGDGLFLLIGWFGILPTLSLWRCFGWRAVGPVVLGGLVYTVGAVGNAVEWPVIVPGFWGPHETFHVFVLVGNWVYWRFVWTIAVDPAWQRLPNGPPVRERRTTSVWSFFYE